MSLMWMCNWSKIIRFVIKYCWFFCKSAHIAEKEENRRFKADIIMNENSNLSRLSISFAIDFIIIHNKSKITIDQMATLLNLCWVTCENYLVSMCSLSIWFIKFSMIFDLFILCFPVLRKWTKLNWWNVSILNHFR